MIEPDENPKPKNGKTMPLLQSRVKADTLEELRTASEETGRTVSSIVRSLLESWVALRRKNRATRTTK